MTELSSGVDLDVGYGRTPEKAILAALQKQPAFNDQGARYIGERPAFWDVTPRHFHDHDWDQYKWGRSFESDVKDHPITISVRDRLDPVPGGRDARKYMQIDNILLNVERAGVGKDPDESGEKRAKVSFKVTIMMRGSAWDGTDEPTPGELVWRAERMSTKFLD